MALSFIHRYYQKLDNVSWIGHFEIYNCHGTILKIMIFALTFHIKDNVVLLLRFSFIFASFNKDMACSVLLPYMLTIRIVKYKYEL